jgi:hypothetical protein
MDIDIPSLPVPWLPLSVKHHRTTGSSRNIPSRLIFIANQKESRGGNNLHETEKGSLKMFQVTVNVRMVKLQASQDDLLGLVVQELRPLIKKGTVILISFDDHPRPLSLLESAIKVDWDTTDKETRLPFGLGQDPGHEGARRRLPMRANNHNGSLRTDQESP